MVNNRSDKFNIVLGYRKRVNRDVIWLIKDKSMYSRHNRNSSYKVNRSWVLGQSNHILECNNKDISIDYINIIRRSTFTSIF